MFSCRTNEEMFVCLKYCLGNPQPNAFTSPASRSSMTYARTLEKSVDGDMTKLSLLFDHEIRFCIAGSSNMLKAPSAHRGIGRGWRPRFS